jgi:hypothetical protein
MPTNSFSNSNFLQQNQQGFAAYSCTLFVRSKKSQQLFIGQLSDVRPMGCTAPKRSQAIAETTGKNSRIDSRILSGSVFWNS